MPAWNLDENSISKSWAPLVIGGRVEAFEVICDSEQVATRYRAVVKLRLVFADSQMGRILHTTTIESTSGLEHFRCTQEGMQEQINSALSLALEKILDNNYLDNVLREVGSVRDENLVGIGAIILHRFKRWTAPFYLRGSGITYVFTFVHILYNACKICLARFLELVLKGTRMGVVALRTGLLRKRLVHVQRPGCFLLKYAPHISMAPGAGPR